MEEERRKCRMCEGGEETWEHIWEEYTEWGKDVGWQEMIEKVLGEEGEGEKWMKWLEKIWEGEGREDSKEEVIEIKS